MTCELGVAKGSLSCGRNQSGVNSQSMRGGKQFLTGLIDSVLNLRQQIHDKRIPFSAQQERAGLAFAET